MNGGAAIIESPSPDFVQSAIPKAQNILPRSQNNSLVLFIFFISSPFVFKKFCHQIGTFFLRNPTINLRFMIEIQRKKVANRFF